MTTLTITPDIAKKKLKLAGVVASGENVEVTVAGFGAVLTDHLQLRVMMGGVAVGVFPLEENDAWTVSGSDLTCVLNLATEQAERFCKFGAEVCVVLEDTDTPQLYGVSNFRLLPWIKLAGVDVPVNLDNYKIKFSCLEEALRRHVENTDNPHGVTKSDVGLGNVDNTSDADKPVSRAQNDAIANLRTEMTEADNTLRSRIAEKYEKPSGGIPKTDMSAAVQTSLDKADTVTLKVSKSAFDSLLGLTLADTATQKEVRVMVQTILGVLKNAAVCLALMLALPALGVDSETVWEEVEPTNKVKDVVEKFSSPGITTNDVCVIVTNEVAEYTTNDKWICNNPTGESWAPEWNGTGWRMPIVEILLPEDATSYTLKDEQSPEPGQGDYIFTRIASSKRNALGLARMTDLPMVETNAINAAMAYTDSKEYTVVERPTVYKYYVTTNANIEAGGGGAQVITNVFPGMAFDLYETNSVYFIDGSVPTLKFFAPYRRQAYWPNMVTAVEIGDPMQVLRTYFFQVDGNMAVNSPTNIRFMATLDRNAPYDQGRAMSLQDYLDAFNPVLVPETIRLFQTNRSNYSVGNVTAHTSLSVERANGEKSFEVTPEAANFMDSMKVVPSVGRIRYIEGMTNEQGTVTNYYAYAVTNADVEITGNMSVSDSVAVSNLAVKGAMRFSSWENIGVQQGAIVFSLSNFVYQLCGPLLKYTFGDLVDCTKHHQDWYDGTTTKIFRIPAYNKYTYLYDAAVMDTFHMITNVTVILPYPDGSLVGSNYLSNDLRSYLDTKFIFDLEGVSHAITLDLGSCNFTNRTNRWGIDGEWTTIYSDVEPTNIVEQVVHTETTVYYDWIEDPVTGEWVEDLENPYEITTEWYDEYSMDMIWRLEPYKAYEFHLQQVGPTTMRLNWKQLYRTNPHSSN